MTAFIGQLIFVKLNEYKLFERLYGTLFILAGESLRFELYLGEID